MSIFMPSTMMLLSTVRETLNTARPASLDKNATDCTVYERGCTHAFNKVVLAFGDKLFPGDENRETRMAFVRSVVNNNATPKETELVESIRRNEDQIGVKVARLVRNILIETGGGKESTDPITKMLWEVVGEAGIPKPNLTCHVCRRQWPPEHVVGCVCGASAEEIYV